MYPFFGLLAAYLLAVPGVSDERERMVHTQIEARGVRDPRVLDAMRRIPREEFVPRLLRAEAYSDHPLPIGHGQTISQPFVVALMTELLAVERTSKVLEIGTGSGYQAAVLSILAKQVYSIEIVPELARFAEATMRRLGYTNVAVRCGDGYRGLPEQAPFDRIILTAAPRTIPQALIDQLKPGGKLVAPEGPTPLDQQLVVLEKSANGRITRREVLAVRFVPMVPEK